MIIVTTAERRSKKGCNKKVVIKMLKKLLITIIINSITNFTCETMITNCFPCVKQPKNPKIFLPPIQNKTPLTPIPDLKQNQLHVSLPSMLNNVPNNAPNNVPNNASNNVPNNTPNNSPIFKPNLPPKVTLPPIQDSNDQEFIFQFEEQFNLDHSCSRDTKTQNFIYFENPTDHNDSKINIDEIEVHEIEFLKKAEVLTDHLEIPFKVSFQRWNTPLYARFILGNFPLKIVKEFIEIAEENNVLTDLIQHDVKQKFDEIPELRKILMFSISRMSTTKNRIDYEVIHKGTITYFSVCCAYNYHQNEEIAAKILMFAANNQNEGVQEFLTKYYTRFKAPSSFVFKIKPLLT